MALQIFYIKKAFGESESQVQNFADQINITVFLISLLYLSSVSVFSFPCLAGYLKWLYMDSLDTKFGPMVMVGKFTLPLLNAALFPTILILRKPDLRAKYLNYLLNTVRLPHTILRKVCHRVKRTRGYIEI
jgi:hypothetical protein